MRRIDNKRKAAEEPDAPKASKRVKNSQTASPEQDKRSLKLIPFREKVSAELLEATSLHTKLLSLPSQQ